MQSLLCGGLAGHPVFSTRNKGWWLVGEEQENKPEPVCTFADDKKESAGNCIIDINHLSKILKKETHCQSCTKKRDVVDECSSHLKSALNISIAQKVKTYFKEHYHYHEFFQA
eukprot:4275372-Ditylum_brightwellii.AAC.1